MNNLNLLQVNLHLVENIKLLPHSYDVSIISDPAMIVEFSSKYDKIKYWAPVEQSSQFDG